MTFTLLACICFALAGTVVIMGVWRLPVRAHCPDCGTRTASVVAPRWVRWLGLPVHARWCLSCGWEGFSRRGPGGGVHRAGGPLSGVQWRTDRTSSRTGSSGAAWRHPDRSPNGRTDRTDPPPDGERSGSMDPGEQD